jgi:hypothetical protein
VCPLQNRKILTFAVFLALLAWGCSRKPSGKAASNPNTAPPLTAASNPEPSNNASNNEGIELRSEQPPGAMPRSSAPVEPRSVTLPQGRTLHVRLLQALSSRYASPGQAFDAELATPVVVDGRTVLPKSTRLRGRVVSARPSGRLHNPGYLRLTLDAVQAPDGKWVDIKTTSVRAEGKSHKKRNLAFIGGGTGVGAAIGAIAGGGKGAAIGALSGAGAGTAGAYATGKEDVSFPAESRLVFTTVRPETIG